MADFTPTRSQQQAIQTSGRSVLVSAGAGSGKTRVLTERLMRHVLDPEHPADIDRFVVITFTRASAGELCSRITEELIKASARAEKDPTVSEAFLRHIRRQQALVGKAQIGTIHHFCSSLLRKYSHLTALPPDFKILTEERGDAMKTSIMEKVLDARYERIDSDPDFRELVDTFSSGKDDTAVSALALSLYSKMQCHAFPDRWRDQILAEMEKEITDIRETIWGEEILNHALRVTEYLSRTMDRLIQLSSKDDRARVKYTDNLEQSAEGIRAFSRCIRIGWEQARSCPPPQFPRVKSLPDPEDAVLTDAIKTGRDSVKKKLGELQKLLSSDTATLSRELKQTLPAIRALFDLIREFETEFSKEKRKYGYADFSDLEHITAALLLQEDGTPTAVAREIAGYYREIMIDEYQDVSRVQDAIFQAVSRNRTNLFLVGDVKQSIYRFRLSDAEIFNEKYRNYADLSNARESEPVRILLRENFRSCKEVLNCANSVFRRCMSEALGDVEYNDHAALIIGSTAYSETILPVPELTLVQASENGRQAEAAYAAAKIQELVTSGATVLGKNGPRPMEYGDIAILLRNANSVGSIYRRALSDRGIPVVTVQGGGFFGTREIVLMLSLFQIMDNPHHDAELTAVLSSPVYGFTPDELAEIRCCDKSSDLWNTITAILRAEEAPCTAETKEKLRKFTLSVASFRSSASNMTSDRLIRKIYADTSLPTIFSAMPDGEQREANLNRLIRLAANFERDGNHGFHRFVLYLQQLCEKNAEIPASQDRVSAVQILSIHRSKGLEYPVVFLCDTSHKINRSDMTDTIPVHPRLGLGPKITDHRQNVRYPTVARRAIALRIEQETLSEELRLLYVAMTRPKERLYITAFSKDPGKDRAVWQSKVNGCGEKLESELLSDVQNYLGWLLAAALADREEHLRLNIVYPESAEESDVGNGLPELEEAQESEHLPEPEKTLVERLQYVYPHLEASALPSKVTATELKKYTRSADEDSVPLFEPVSPEGTPARRYFRRPEFVLEQKPLTATEKGIATHLVLQHMDLNLGKTLSGVAAETERLCKEEFLSERQKDAVNQAAIVRLFSSSLGKRILNAPKLHREFRFSILCDAEAVFSKAPGEEILLQGVVDCCIENEDSLIIIDYKTDHVYTEEQLRERKELYSRQMEAYALALRRIFGKPVEEAVLVFLLSGKTLTLPMK